MPDVEVPSHTCDMGRDNEARTASAVREWDLTSTDPYCNKDDVKDAADAAIAALKAQLVKEQLVAAADLAKCEQQKRGLAKAAKKGIVAANRVIELEAQLAAAPTWATVKALQEQLKEAEYALGIARVSEGTYRDMTHALTESLEQAEARAEALYEKRLPCREAEIAQRRYEQAEARAKALECCATCDHFDSFGSAMYCTIECPERIDAYDHQRPYESRCRYEPSRWTNSGVEGGTG